MADDDSSDLTSSRHRSIPSKPSMAASSSGPDPSVRQHSADKLNNAFHPPTSFAAAANGRAPNLRLTEQISVEGVISRPPTEAGPLPPISTSAPSPVGRFHATQPLHPQTISLASTLLSPSLTNEPSPASASPHGEIPGRQQCKTPGPAVYSGPNIMVQANSGHNQQNTATDFQAQPVQLQAPIQTPAAIPVSTAMQQAGSMVDRRVAEYNGYEAIVGTIEKPRYRVLRDACESGDLFYLSLHRYFCLWSRNRPLVHSLLPVAPNAVDTTFMSLLGVLRKNEDMAPTHLLWFSEFPEFLPQVEGFRETMYEMFEFLTHFASHWQSLITQVQGRMCPLLAAETRYYLRCGSPLLEGMLFTLSRRAVGIEDGSVANQLKGLFSKDQAKERRMLEQRATSEALAKSREDIAVRYKSLIGQALRLAPQPTAALAPQPSQNTVPPIPPNDPALQQPQLGHLAPPRGQSQRPIAGEQPALAPRLAKLPDLRHPPPNAPLMTVPSNGPSMTMQLPATNLQQQSTIPPQPFLQRHPSWSSTSPTSHQLATGSQSSSQIHNSQRIVSATAVPYQQHQPQVIQSPTDEAFRSTSNIPTQPNLPPMPHNQYEQNNPPLRPPELRPGVRNSSRPAARKTTVGPSIPQFTTHAITQNEYASSSYDWTSVSSGLHLVGLRSPRRSPLHPDGTRFYQFFDRFVVEPIPISPQPGLRVLEFIVSEGSFSYLSVTSTSSDLPTCQYFNGSLRYRLRLCERQEGDDAQSIDEATWSICRVYWPQHIFILFNDQAKLLRRKQQFHHDLPVELTDSIVAGKNVLKVSLPPYAANVNPGKAYFLAVELINTLNHKSVRNLVESGRHVSSDETKREIQRRLTYSDSDDILIENDTLTVAVTDPFSSRLFEVPVRGRNCKHLECIDLQNWLLTRPSKPLKSSAEPSMVDAWICPICGLDARPPNLQVDDFFVEVREKLLQNGHEDIKQIVISANGNWSVVEEPEDDETPGPNITKRDGSEPKASRTPVIPETIEILDD